MAGLLPDMSQIVGEIEKAKREFQLAADRRARAELSGRIFSRLIMLNDEECNLEDLSDRRVEELVELADRTAALITVRAAQSVEASSGE